MNIFIWVIFIFFVPILLLLTRSRSSKRLPPGSLGIPMIGQSFSLLRALKKNTAEEWLQQRIKKYGPVSKLTLFGKPTVFLSGQAANKLVFTSDHNTMSNRQTKSIMMIIAGDAEGELSREDHQCVRGAIVSFLQPDSLKRYVRAMDEEVREHIKLHWHGKQEVTVLPLMKALTFNMICSLLFTIDKGLKREKYMHCFQTMVKGLWSIPINFPFTQYNKSLRESTKVRAMIKDLIKEKKARLEKEPDAAHQDLISHLLRLRLNSTNEELSEKDVVQYAIVVMIAGHDTNSVLLTFLIRLLAQNEAVYAAVLREHEEIEKSKQPGEYLTWEDINKMKYTWRVALETMRLIPPVFGGFRQALKDIEFNGYVIPKGWQIFWATSMTHMDESIFREPSKFEPSRFENQSLIPRFGYATFGGGPSICPGIEFAKVETLVAIHYFIIHFTWKLSADDGYSRYPMPTPTKDLPIQITPRKPL